MPEPNTATLLIFRIEVVAGGCFQTVQNRRKEQIYDKREGGERKFIVTINSIQAGNILETWAVLLKSVRFVSNRKP